VVDRGACSRSDRRSWDRSRTGRHQPSGRGEARVGAAAGQKLAGRQDGEYRGLAVGGSGDGDPGASPESRCSDAGAVTRTVGGTGPGGHAGSVSQARGADARAVADSVTSGSGPDAVGVPSAYTVTERARLRQPALSAPAHAVAGASC
jgi:hypothetical protein